MAALIGMGSGTTNSPPPNCIGLGTHVTTSLKGETNPVEDLGVFKAVGLLPSGEKTLLDAQVIRTVSFGPIDIYSHGPQMHLSGGHTVILQKDRLGCENGFFCSKCKKGGEDYGQTTCRLCGAYKGALPPGYTSVVVKHARKTFQRSKAVNIWYHVMLYDEEGNQSHLPFELSDGIFSEPLRSPLTEERSKDWMVHC